MNKNTFASPQRSKKETISLFAFMPEKNGTTGSYDKHGKMERVLQFEDNCFSFSNIGEIFKRIMADTKKVTIEEYLDFPVFPPLETLDPAVIKQELISALKLLEEHRIVIEMAMDYPDEEIYRFIADELMQEEMEFKFEKDGYFHFSFEKYFDTEEIEAIDTSRELLKILFSNDWRFINTCLFKDFCVNDITYSNLSIRAFRLFMKKQFETWEYHDSTIMVEVLSRDKAVVRAEVNLRKKGNSTERTLQGLVITLGKINGQFKATEIKGLC